MSSADSILPRGNFYLGEHICVYFIAVNFKTHFFENKITISSFIKF